MQDILNHKTLTDLGFEQNGAGGLLNEDFADVVYRKGNFSLFVWKNSGQFIFQWGNGQKTLVESVQKLEEVYKAVTGRKLSNKTLLFG